MRHTDLWTERRKRKPSLGDQSSGTSAGVNGDSALYNCGNGTVNGHMNGAVDSGSSRTFTNGFNYYSMRVVNEDSMRAVNNCSNGTANGYLNGTVIDDSFGAVSHGSSGTVIGMINWTVDGSVTSTLNGTVSDVSNVAEKSDMDKDPTFSLDVVNDNSGNKKVSSSVQDVSESSRSSPLDVPVKKKRKGLTFSLDVDHDNSVNGEMNSSVQDVSESSRSSPLGVPLKKRGKQRNRLLYDGTLQLQFFKGEWIRCRGVS